MSNWEVVDYEVDDREEEVSEMDMPETIQGEGVQEIEDPVSLEDEIEMAVEDLDRILENISPLKKPETEPEIPDVWWREDLENIKNPILQKREIEKAERWKDEENRRIEKYVSEGKDLKYFGADNPDLARKGIKDATSAGFASVDLSYDQLGDVSEDASALQTGNLKLVETKDRVKGLLRQVDPEVAKEIAERVIEEHELSEEDEQPVRRLVRLRETGEI